MKLAKDNLFFIELIKIMLLATYPLAIYYVATVAFKIKQIRFFTKNGLWQGWPPKTNLKQTENLRAILSLNFSLIY